MGINVGETLMGLVTTSGIYQYLTNPLALIMVAIACVLLYLAIVKQFEPLLLLPIAFGMLLTNLLGSDIFHEELFAGGHANWALFGGAVLIDGKDFVDSVGYMVNAAGQILTSNNAVLGHFVNAVTIDDPTSLVPFADILAQFAANGKMNRKKDLGLMAMSYGNVYVAQIAMGASQEQTLKAISEAEAYPGPSLIIAYSPCLNHGIKGGLGNSQMQAKRAVEAGYWSLYHYDPRRIGQGENPFVLDSKEPSNDFKEFLLSEVRYSSLMRQFPERAEMLYEKAEADAKARRSNYTRLANK